MNRGVIIGAFAGALLLAASSAFAQNKHFADWPAGCFDEWSSHPTSAAATAKMTIA